MVSRQLPGIQTFKDDPDPAARPTLLQLFRIQPAAAGDPGLEDDPEEDPERSP